MILQSPPVWWSGLKAFPSVSDAPRRERLHRCGGVDWKETSMDAAMLEISLHLCGGVDWKSNFTKFHPNHRVSTCVVEWIERSASNAARPFRKVSTCVVEWIERMYIVLRYFNRLRLHLCGGVDWKILCHEQDIWNLGLHLCGGVDWKTEKSTTFPFSASLHLCGGVDWKDS